MSRKILGKRTENTTRQRGSASPSAPSSASASSLWDNWVKKQQEEEEERKRKQQEANAAGGNNAGLSDQAENHNAQQMGSRQQVSGASIGLSRKILANKKAAEDTGFAAYADALKTDPQKMAEARKAGATATADGQAKDHAHVYQTNDPYDLGNEYLNQMMALNLEAAKGWNVKSWDGLNLKDDIKDITKRWYENRKTSEALNLSNPTGKDPLGAADALMQKEMDQLRAKYESNGRTYNEMRELMAGQDIRDPYEIEKKNREKIYKEANTLYPKENPQAQEEWRRMFKDAQADRMAPNVAAGQIKDATPYDDLGNAARNIRQGNGYLVSAEERQAFEEFAEANPDVMATNDTRAIQEAAAEWGRKKAEQQRANLKNEMLGGTYEDIQVPSRVLNYEQADAYLRERDSNGLYAIARDKAGETEEIARLLEDSRGIFEKMREAEGAPELTESEQIALEYLRRASGNPEDIAQWALTPEGANTLKEAGAQLAQDLRGQAAAYPGAQKWGAYEQGLWDELIRTPEGAQYYAENARGTDKESRAKENLYWANQEERIRAALADPDFEALSKPQGNDGELMNKIDMFGPATYADYMDDRDKALYYYYLNTGKEDEAHKYLEALKYSINEKKALEDKENQQKKLNEGNVLDWIGENLWSIPESVIGGPMGMADLIGQNWGNVEKPEWMPDWLWRGINPYSALNNGEYKPVDTNSQWQYLSKNAKTTREETSQKIAELSESVGVNSYLPVQVYNGVMSLLDSRAGAELMNGLFGSTKTASTLGAFLTGTRSGQEYMLKAYENGGSDEQALQMGLVAGFFETAWEKLELSIFFKTANTVGPKAAWEKLVEFGLVTLENGLQEGGTEQSDLMAEQWIMGDLSEMEQMAAYLSDMGMNEDEIKKAIQDQWMQRVWDATVGGLIMGGISDAAAQSMSAYKTNEYNKQAASLMNKNTKQTLADLAKASADETTRKMGEKFDAATATDKQAGKLLAQVTKNLPEEMRGKVQGLMREQVRMSAQEELAPMTLDVSNALIAQNAGLQLTEQQQKALQSYYNGMAVADSIAALFAQQELTQEQIAALASSEKGMDIVRRIMNSDNAADSENGSTEENNAEDRQTNQDEEWEDMPTAQDEETREPQPLQNGPEERRAAMDEEARDEGEQEPEPLQNKPEERRAAMDEEARDEGEQEPEPLQNKPEERRAAMDEEARDEGEQEQEQEPQPLQNGPEERRAAMDEEARDEGEQEPERKKENAVPVRVKGEDAEHRAAFRATDDGMEAELEDGTRRSADELELTDAQRRAVEEAGALKDDAAANDMIDMLQGEQDENGVRKKAKAYGEAYRQGLSGAEFDAGSMLYEGLTEDEARRAYEMGKKQAQQQAQQRAQSAREAAKRDGYRAEADANAEENGLFYGDVQKGATDSQRSVMLRLIDPYAREHGLHVVAHDDMGDVNGKYRKDDRTIHISLNADDGNLTRVASHEIFHFVMDQDAEQGGRLRDFVIEQLQNQKGYDLEGRIQDIQDTYRDAKGQELSRDEALEEIAADALGDIIGTEDNLKKLIRREQAANPGDLSLAERLKNWLGRIIQRFKALQKRFQQSSPEGLALQDQTDTLEKMRQMIETALQTIQKNREGAKAGLYDGISDDADVEAYVAEKDTAATQEDADAALNVLLAQLFNRTQQGWIGANMDAYDQGLADFTDALGKFGRGEINSVAMAMVQKGLDAPMGQKENQLYSYAARQIVENGKGERFELRRGAKLDGNAYDYTKPFAEQLDDFLNGRIPKNNLLFVGTTPQIMQKMGLDRLPVAIRQDHVSDVLFGTYKIEQYRDDHIYDIEDFVNLPEKMENPVAVIRDAKDPEGSIMVLIELNSKSGKNSVAPIQLKGSGSFDSQYYDVQRITTVHGNSDAVSMLESAIRNDRPGNIRLFYVDAEKAMKYLGKEKSQQLVLDPGAAPGVGFPDGIIHSITDEGSPVNKKNLIHQTETQQFMRWFGDSKATDEDGQPKVMYHGTRAQFTVFDRKKAKSSGLYGKGFYFTDTPSHAGQYGDQMAVYLRAENPLTPGDKKITKNQIIKLLEAIAEDEDLGLDNYGQNATPRSVANAVFDGRDDFQILQDINATAVGDFAETIRLFNEINGTEYDSIITPTETVVYSPFQIKSATDNKGFFDVNNPDIRYSVKADADSRAQDQRAEQSVQADADVLARIKQDKDAAAALKLLKQLHDTTTRGGDDALIKKGAFESRLSDIAQGILDNYASEYKKSTLMRDLRKLYQGMEGTRYSAGDLLVYAKDVIMKVLDKAPGVLQNQDETTQEIIKTLKNTPFFLTADEINELHYTYDSALFFRRKNFGRMHIVKERSGVTSLPNLWMETLNPMNPGLFSEETSELDMPMILDEWLEKVTSKSYTDIFDRPVAEEATDMALKTMLQFYDVPGALKSKGEILDAARQKWYEKEKERIEIIKGQAQKAMETAREKYNDRYNERISRSQERKKETERKQQLRKSIERTVKVINKLNVSPSDQRHVPEGMRRAALDAVRPFLNDTSVFNQANVDRLGRVYGILAQRQGEAAGFDQDILDSIQQLGPKIDGRRLSELTEQELSDINDIVGNVHKAITGANEAFLEGRKTTVDALSGQLKADMQDRKAREGKAAETVRKLSYRETTPIYFADRAGGVIKEMVGDLFSGQETWAFMAQKAKAFADEQIEKYHANDWMNGKDTLRFTTRQGDEIELTRQEALSLYALWERENRNKLQEAKHLKVGGFMYEKGAEHKGVDKMKPHAISDQDMAQVKSWLTPEQMEFADAMVGYLSDELSKAGNKVSMDLYGYEKFKEEYYFPYASDKRFMVGDLTNTAERQSQPKNAGFTKATMRNAATPITVGKFMEIWGKHVNQMAVYCGFAETIDTMNRVLNDRISGEVRVDNATGEETVVAPESNWIVLEKALGAEGVNYLKTLAHDVSGGVRADERGDIMAKGLSRFKKAAVAANLSVVLQQPTAYARAMMMVSPKYLLTANPTHIARNIKEMYKYSGVAIIKKMGKFDTGTGESAVEWLTDGIKEETAGKRILSALDEWTGKGAEKADEWTWGLLWDAISKEVENTRTDLNRGTDEFGRAVAERFNDVVNHTQVYDSVLSRSEWMRSNATIDKMATSFMAEPTLSLNMLQDAIVRYKEEGGGTKRVARAAGAFALNALLTALAKSVMTATRRKDDEGRTWLEKYLAEAAGNFADDISPFGLAGLIPWVRDAVSIFEGYSVERSDMDAVEMLYKAYKTLANDNKSFEDKMQEVCGAVGNLFGIPIKNVWRDMEGIARNIFFGASAPISETSGRDIKYSVLDNLSMGPISLWSSENKAYYDRLEKAALNGDTALYEELYGYLTETKQVKPSSVISGLKNEIKDSYTNGLITEDKALDVLTGTLGMEKNDAYWMLDELNAKKAGQEDGYSKYSAFDRAIETGQNLKAEVKRYTEHGVEEKTMASHITSQYKQQYVELMKAGKKAEAANLKARLLTAYEALGYDRTKKNEDIDDWMKQEEKKNK